MNDSNFSNYMASASLMQAGFIQLTMSTFLSVILYPRPGHKIMY